MTLWTPDLSQYSGPRYAAIAAAIGAATSAGHLTPGDRLPPQRELAHQLGLTVGTISRAYALAEQRGLVRGEIGRGTFVSDRNSGMLRTDRAAVADLSMNMPLSSASSEALAATLASVARDAGVGNLLRYMPTAGHVEHRTAIAQWTRRSGFSPNADNIVLTQGAQQALAAVFDVLVRSGKSVLVEELTYPGLIENARLKGIRLATVAMDDEGMLPDALAERAAESGARVVIVVPTLQNPTSAVMSRARRAALARVAEDFDLTIVEDDVYGYLSLDRPAPIDEIAPERTVYITSASKCLAPGLRVGWLVAPDHQVKAFADIVYAQSVAQPALNVELIRRWIEDGTASRLVDELRDETVRRFELAMSILSGHRIRGHAQSFHALLDLPPPWRRDDFVGLARAAGVKLSSIDAFIPDSRIERQAVRLSLVGAGDRASLGAALEILSDLLNSAPRTARNIV
jgi:DNA-binding transcriptional MocR family regulator